MHSGQIMSWIIVLTASTMVCSLVTQYQLKRERPPSWDRLYSEAFVWCNSCREGRRELLERFEAGGWHTLQVQQPGQYRPNTKEIFSKSRFAATGGCQHQGSVAHVESESNTHPFLRPLKGRGLRRWNSVLRVVQLLDRVQVGEVWVLPADACAVLRKLLAGG